jgi:hypothetical protein
MVSFNAKLSLDTNFVRNIRNFLLMWFTVLAVWYHLSLRAQIGSGRYITFAPYIPECSAYSNVSTHTLAFTLFSEHVSLSNAALSRKLPANHLTIQEVLETFVEIMISSASKEHLFRGASLGARSICPTVMTAVSQLHRQEHF